MSHTGSERAMITPGNLVSFGVREEYHKYKDDSFEYEIKYALACQHEEMHTTHLQLLQLAITFLTSLAWPDLFLAMGVIACSISAQPKRVWSGLYRQVVLTPPWC